jgi:hypothetical protein
MALRIVSEAPLPAARYEDSAQGEREVQLQMMNRDVVIRQNQVPPPGVSGPILALPRVCASDADT